MHAYLGPRSFFFFFFWAVGHLSRALPLVHFGKMIIATANPSDKFGTTTQIIVINKWSSYECLDEQMVFFE